MKVKDPSEIRPVDTRKPPEPPRATRPDGAAPPDRVSTDETARLARVVAAARQGADASRAARVEAIEAAIRQGTLRPDPQRIAQKILDDAELTAMLRALLDR